MPTTVSLEGMSFRHFQMSFVGNLGSGVCVVHCCVENKVQKEREINVTALCGITNRLRSFHQPGTSFEVIDQAENCGRLFSLSGSFYAHACAFRREVSPPLILCWVELFSVADTSRGASINATTLMLRCVYEVSLLDCPGRIVERFRKVS